MYKILVVDDEVNIRRVVREYAEFEGYEVAEAENGMEAVEMVKSEDFDLIVMDIMMPKLDGFSTCKEIKKYKTVPVIMLSARGEEYDKLFGFELGIDDYVVKPFSPKELMARIKAVLKRNNVSESTVPEKLVFEGLEIDIAGREVYVDGEKASMTPKEYDLLFYLVKNKNLALTRDKLLEEVWGYDFFGDDRTVDTHIKMLRNSLGQYRKFIVTLRGMGINLNTSKIKNAVSLRFKVWEYFMFFTAVVFIMLWFFQIVFLENFYEKMKISDVKLSAKKIVDEYGDDDYGRTLTTIAISNDLCIEIVDKYGRVIYTKDTLGKSCLIHSPDSMKGEFLNKLKESGKKEIYFKEYNSAISNDMLVFAAVIGSADSPEGYVLINTPLVPVGSTASIIKRQLLIITIYLIILSIVISFFMARKIAEPIVKITKSAEKMAAGNYSIKFEGGDYIEIQRLASTLTYAGQQISKGSTLCSAIL